MKYIKYNDTSLPHQTSLLMFRFDAFFQENPQLIRFLNFETLLNEMRVRRVNYFMIRRYNQPIIFLRLFDLIGQIS